MWTGNTVNYFSAVCSSRWKVKLNFECTTKLNWWARVFRAIGDLMGLNLVCICLTLTVLSSWKSLEFRFDQLFLNFPMLRPCNLWPTLVKIQKIYNQVSNRNQTQPGPGQKHQLDCRQKLQFNPEQTEIMWE